MKISTLAITGLTFVITFFSSATLQARDTGIVFAPYLWGQSIKESNTGIDADFSDIISKLNMAASFHTEYRTIQ